MTPHFAVGLGNNDEPPANSTTTTTVSPAPARLTWNCNLLSSMPKTLCAAKCGKFCHPRVAQEGFLDASQRSQCQGCEFLRNIERRLRSELRFTYQSLSFPAFSAIHTGLEWGNLSYGGLTMGLRNGHSDNYGAVITAVEGVENPFGFRTPSDLVNGDQAAFLETARPHASRSASHQSGCRHVLRAITTAASICIARLLPGHCRPGCFALMMPKMQ